MSLVINLITKGNFNNIDDLLQNELYEICDRNHSSCNDKCPVYKVNGYEVPNTTYGGECTCFKNGAQMLQFLRDKLEVEPIVNKWVTYDWMKPETRPKKSGKYFVRRKDGKIHWETWNGSGWAYNEKVITHWQEITFP